MDHHYSVCRKTYAVLALLTSLIITPAAFAEHIYESRMSEVKSLAHQMEEDAREAHNEAERLAHHGNYAEQNALRALHQVEESAVHFHNQVESYYSSPTHTRRDFRNLVSSYNTARATFHQLHAYGSVQYLFARMSSTMNQLSYLYNTVSQGGGYNGGHNGGGHNSGGHNGQNCVRYDVYGNCIQYGNGGYNGGNHGGGHSGGNHGGGHGQSCVRYDAYGNCIKYGNGGHNNGGHLGNYCKRRDSYGNCLDKCRYVDQYGRCVSRPSNSNQCHRRDNYGNCLDNGGGHNNGGHIGDGHDN